MARKDKKCFECEFFKDVCMDPTSSCVNHSNFKQKQTECLASKVTTHKLTPEEIELMTSGQKTYEEIIADKNPVEIEADLTELTKDSYAALKHKGVNDTEIRKMYKISPLDLEDMKKQWFKEVRYLKTIERVNEKQNGKPIDLHLINTKKEAKTSMTTLTKELLIKHMDEGMLNKDIMAKYGIDKNMFYKLKKKWGLTNGTGGRPKQEATQHVSDKKLVSIDVYNRSEAALEQAQSKIIELKERHQKAEILLAEKDKSIAALQEQNEILERQCDFVQQLDKELKAAENEITSLKEAAAKQSVQYQEVENKMFSDDDYQKLKDENSELKSALEELQDHSLNTLSEYAKIKKQNEYLQERVDNLLEYQDKYLVTSQALKLHL